MKNRSLFASPLLLLIISASPLPAYTLGSILQTRICLPNITFYWLYHKLILKNEFGTIWNATMKKLFLAVLMLYFSASSNADIPDTLRTFIKADEPESLQYSLVQNSACLWADHEAKDVVEGVIKRSRISPSLGGGGSNKFYLSVVVTCSVLKSVANRDVYAIHFDVGYINANADVKYDRNYGGLVVTVVASKEQLLGDLKEYVESNNRFC